MIFIKAALFRVRTEHQIYNRRMRKFDIHDVSGVTEKTERDNPVTAGIYANPSRKLKLN
jgi:hypothetical protein